MFGSIFSAIGRAAKVVGGAIVRGVEAVTEVGSKVVAAVKAGWETVKKTIRRVVERVTGPLSRPPAEKVGKQRADVREKATVDVVRVPRVAEPAPATEIHARVDVEPLTGDRFSLPQRAVQRAITPDLHARFTALAAGVRTDLATLLASNEIRDFSAYARSEMSLKMLDTIRHRLERDTTDDAMLRFANRAVDLLQRLTERGELTHAEWSDLEELSFELWNESLLRRGLESVFMLWTSEYRETRDRVLAIGQHLDDIDLEESLLVLERDKRRITPTQSDRLLRVPEERVSLNTERDGLRRRLGELKRVVGVSEGMLLCLEEREEDQQLVREAEQISPILLAWQRGETLSADDGLRLDRFALSYERRAIDRLHSAIDSVEVSA